MMNEPINFQLTVITIDIKGEKRQQKEFDRYLSPIVLLIDILSNPFPQQMPQISPQTLMISVEEEEEGAVLCLSSLLSTY